ncbi:MAG: hypothetical protein WC960_06155 [Bacteroidales bacterium]
MRYHLSASKECYSSPSFEVLELEFEQNILGGSGDLPEELEGIEWP